MFYTTNDHIDNIFRGIQEPLWKTGKLIIDHLTDFHYEDGVFTMALPGFSKKDLDIEMEGSTLKISADIKEKDETLYKKSFEKKFRASNIDVESVTANMSDGILTIMLDKKVNQKKIKVI